MGLAEPILLHCFYELYGQRLMNLLLFLGDKTHEATALKSLRLLRVRSTTWIENENLQAWMERPGNVSSQASLSVTTVKRELRSSGANDLLHILADEEETFCTKPCSTTAKRTTIVAAPGRPRDMVLSIRLLRRRDVTQCGMFRLFCVRQGLTPRSETEN
jgi:hypothetical protein